MLMLSKLATQIIIISICYTYTCIHVYIYMCWVFRSGHNIENFEGFFLELKICPTATLQILAWSACGKSWTLDWIMDPSVYQATQFKSMS